MHKSRRDAWDICFPHNLQRGADIPADIDLDFRFPEPCTPSCWLISLSAVAALPGGIIQAAGNLASEASVLVELLGMYTGLGCAQQCVPESKLSIHASHCSQFWIWSHGNPDYLSHDVVQQPEPLGKLGNLCALDPAKQRKWDLTHQNWHSQGEEACGCNAAHTFGGHP